MFKSPIHAICFAFQMNSVPIYKAPFTNRFYRPPGLLDPYRSGNELLDGLTQEDRQKQAQSILRMIDSLDEASRAYIACKYGSIKDISSIEKWLGARYQQSGSDDVIRSYLWRPKSLKSLRESMNVGTARVKTIKKDIYDLLDALHITSIREIESILKKAKLI